MSLLTPPSSFIYPSEAPKGMPWITQDIDAFGGLNIFRDHKKIEETIFRIPGEVARILYIPDETRGVKSAVWHELQRTWTPIESHDTPAPHDPEFSGRITILPKSTFLALGLRILHFVASKKDILDTGHAYGALEWWLMTGRDMLKENKPWTIESKLANVQGGKVAQIAHIFKKAA